MMIKRFSWTPCQHLVKKPRNFGSPSLSIDSLRIKQKIPNITAPTTGVVIALPATCGDSLKSRDCLLLLPVYCAVLAKCLWNRDRVLAVLVTLKGHDHDLATISRPSPSCYDPACQLGNETRSVLPILLKLEIARIETLTTKNSLATRRLQNVKNQKPCA